MKKVLKKQEKQLTCKFLVLFIDYSAFMNEVLIPLDEELLNECIENLNIKPDGVYLDGTVGGAGHSLEISKLLNEKGTLIGMFLLVLLSNI